MPTGVCRPLFINSYYFGKVMKLKWCGKISNSSWRLRALWKLGIMRATPAVEQKREKKQKIDAFGKNISSSSGAISGAKFLLINSDQLNLMIYS